MKSWMARKLYEHDDDSKLPYASTRVVIADEAQAEIDELNKIHADMFRKTGGILAKTELCKIIDRQDAEIAELVDMLDTVIKCWRGTEPNDPSRAIVRAAGDEIIAKHKQEKE